MTALYLKVNYKHLTFLMFDILTFNSARSFVYLLRSSVVEIKMVKKLFECYLCHKSFKFKKSNLTRHLKLHELIQKRYGCPRCEKVFQNQSNYRRH